VTEAICPACEAAYAAGASHVCDPDDVAEVERAAARRERREATMAPAWSPVERRIVSGDFRDYLDGRPIETGAWLELQAVEPRDDEDGTYDARIAAGVIVRYEIAHVPPSPDNPWGRVVELTGALGGHLVQLEAMPWHRFRWPT
jgi:hypothetical protein